MVGGKISTNMWSKWVLCFCWWVHFNLFNRFRSSFNLHVKHKSLEYWFKQTWTTPKICLGTYVCNWNVLLLRFRQRSFSLNEKRKNISKGLSIKSLNQIFVHWLLPNILKVPQYWVYTFVKTATWCLFIKKITW